MSTDLSAAVKELRGLLEKATPAPWTVCHHLQSVEKDKECPCGYRGVVFGPDRHGVAVCQPGHEPAPKGEEGTEPPSYQREQQIADMRLVAAMRRDIDALLAAAEERDELALALSKSVSAMSLALTGGGDKYAHAIRTAHDAARAALRAADTTAGGAE